MNKFLCKLRFIYDVELLSAQRLFHIARILFECVNVDFVYIFCFSSCASIIFFYFASTSNIYYCFVRLLYVFFHFSLVRRSSPCTYFRGWLLMPQQLLVLFFFCIQIRIEILRAGARACSKNAKTLGALEIFLSIYVGDTHMFVYLFFVASFFRLFCVAYFSP